MDILAALAGLAAFAAPAADAHVTCAQHVEPPAPALVERDGVNRVWNARVGDAQLQLMTTGEGGPSRMRDRRVWVWKTPFALTAGSDVIVTVVGGGARFQYGRAKTFRRSARTVRFTACAADEPLFSGPGVVGPVTAWSGGLLTRERRTCLRLRVTGARPQAGERAATLTVPLGRRRCA